MGRSVAANNAFQLIQGGFEDLTPEQRRQMERRLRTATRLVQQLEEELYFLRQLAKNGRSGGNGRPARDEAALRRVQLQGISGITIQSAPGDTAIAKVDGFDQPVWLGGGAILPALLEALCELGTDDMVFVGFKSPETLIASTADTSGKEPISAHSLRTHIGMLRDRFEQAGMSATFIPNKHGTGYRLLLQRDAEVTVKLPRRRQREAG